MTDIQIKIQHIQQQIADVATQYNRNPEDIQLLAVSKTRPATDVLTAYQGGQRCFGENYVQEAVEKIHALAHLSDIEWHYIGPIQSNKTRLLAENFAWVQSLDSLKHAQRLSDQRPDVLPPLNVCIQVNISDETQKSGVNLDVLSEFAQAVATLPRIKLRGLMAIPAPCDDFEQQRVPFRALYQAQQRLQQQGLTLDTLSMGMTNDMPAAIAEGATMVRIGTAIFGARTSKAKTQ